MLTAICSGLYPNIAFVLRPPKRFIETSGGAVQKSTELNDFRFYIPNEKTELQPQQSQSQATTMTRIASFIASLTEDKTRVLPRSASNTRGSLKSQPLRFGANTRCSTNDNMSCHIVMCCVCACAIAMCCSQRRRSSAPSEALILVQVQAAVAVATTAASSVSLTYLK